MVGLLPSWCYSLCEREWLAMKETPMDVAKAAERLRRIGGGETVESVYAQPYRLEHQVGQYDHPYHADMRLSLGKYLAEHDQTPITEAWLRSVGFERFEPSGSGVFISATHDGIQLSQGYRGQWLIESCEMSEDAEPKTRGDVRRLAAALGIQLATP